MYRERASLIKETPEKSIYRAYKELSHGSLSDIYFKVYAELLKELITDLFFFPGRDVEVLSEIVLDRESGNITATSARILDTIAYKLDKAADYTLSGSKNINISNYSSKLETPQNDIKTTTGVVIEREKESLEATKDIIIERDKENLETSRDVMVEQAIKKLIRQLKKILDRYTDNIHLSTSAALGADEKNLIIKADAAVESQKGILSSTKNRELIEQENKIHIQAGTSVEADEEKAICINKDTAMGIDKIVSLDTGTVLEIENQIDITSHSADTLLDKKSLQASLEEAALTLAIDLYCFFTQGLQLRLTTECQLIKEMNKAAIKKISEIKAEADHSYLSKVKEITKNSIMQLSKVKEITKNSITRLSKVFELSDEKITVLEKLIQDLTAGEQPTLDLTNDLEIFEAEKNLLMLWETAIHMLLENHRNFLSNEQQSEAVYHIVKAFLSSNTQIELYKEKEQGLNQMYQGGDYAELLITEAATLLHHNAFGLSASENISIDTAKELTATEAPKLFTDERELVNGSIQTLDIEKEVTSEKNIPIARGKPEITISEADSLEAADLHVLIDCITSLISEKDLELLVEKDSIAQSIYRRGWFIRATAPTDLLILPNIDYPYAENPAAVSDYYKDWDVYYWHFEEIKTVVETHPVPDGSELGTSHIEVSIEIIIDMVNMTLMLWSKYYAAFEGWHGVGAVKGLIISIYNWLTLESSIDEMKAKESYDDYMRCYRWLRWEAEAVIHEAREDYTIGGNRWVELYIQRLFKYLRSHHFDTVPIFKSIVYMDLMRDIFRDPQGNIDITLDKVKGMRFYSIEEERRDYIV